MVKLTHSSQQPGVEWRGGGRGLCQRGVKAVVDFHTPPFVPSVVWVCSGHVNTLNRLIQIKLQLKVSLLVIYFPPRRSFQDRT